MNRNLRWIGRIFFPLIAAALCLIFYQYYFKNKTDKVENKPLEFLEFWGKVQQIDSYNQPIDEFECLVDKYPQNIDYKISLSTAYIRQYKFNEAISLAKEVIDTNPQKGEAYTLLALANIQAWRFPIKEI